MDFLFKATINVLKIATCFAVVAAMAVGGKLAIEEYQRLRDRPVIVQKQIVSHPTTIEDNMAKMLGFYSLKLQECRQYVVKAAREIDRLEKRERQLEAYITENGLPIPAEPQKTINLMILD